jgi:hypothetical protein
MIIALTARKTELQSSGAKMTRAPTTTRINLTDLVQLVCGDRVENFPFERQIAIMTFSVWLWHRDQLPVVEYGKLIAAAKVITEINRGTRKRMGPERAQTARTIFEAVATPERTAELLLQNPMMGSFRDDMNFEVTYGGEEAAAVAMFLLRCPSGLKPSLNKAFFFLSEGGYDYKTSIATLKKYWSKFAPISPFVIAAKKLNMIKMFNLPPDGETSFQDATELLRNDEKLRDYFGVSRFVQEKILSVIGTQIHKRIDFITFPRSIEPRTFEFEPLRSEQLQLLAKYRAPKQI